MDWKMYTIAGFLVLLGIVNNWEGIREKFIELYNKRRRK
jgi:hypothetical protein